jgi:hypothetical protein
MHFARKAYPPKRPLHSLDIVRGCKPGRNRACVHRRQISASRPSLRDSCRKQKLSRRDADDPLEMKGKLALVRETDAERDLH